MSLGLVKRTGIRSRELDLSARDNPVGYWLMNLLHCGSSSLLALDDIVAKSRSNVEDIDDTLRSFLESFTSHFNRTSFSRELPLFRFVHERAWEGS